MSTQPEDINNLTVELPDHHKSRKPNSILRARQSIDNLKIWSHVNSIVSHLGLGTW